MTLQRLPAGFNSAVANDLIQRHSDGLWYAKAPADLLGLDTAIIPGRLLVRTIHTTPGVGQVHNLNALTKLFRVYGHGGGGGGGGVNGSGGGTAGVATSGQAGGYFEHLFTISGAFTFVYALGSGGVGGNGGTSGGGGSGLSTQVTYGGITVGAQGGVAGSGVTGSVGAIPSVRGPSTGGGIVIGSPNLFIAGQPASYGTVLADNAVASGQGGTFRYAIGGRCTTSAGTGANGNAGVFGGGGSGAACGGGTEEPDGGPGGDGILIVEEYS